MCVCVLGMVDELGLCVCKTRERNKEWDRHRHIMSTHIIYIIHWKQLSYRGPIVDL